MFELEFWIILFVACILLEIMTTGFFLLSIGIGSATAAVANYIGFDPITQLLIFVIVTVICLIASRPLAKKLTQGSPKKRAASDRLLGKEGTVVEPINIENSGMVNIFGESWRAIADESISIGEKIIVEEIKGVRLKVTKK
ncbi:MAG: NfeD family protein [Methanobacteriaceae archaeon]|jgi:membrane protein implicated in regulation of membrane protease activity|nr:NfeD family protein [Candidatus Methanorudis spinitermitis]